MSARARLRLDAPEVAGREPQAQREHDETQDERQQHARNDVALHGVSFVVW